MTFKTQADRDTGFKRVADLTRKRNLTNEERAEMRALSAADAEYLKAQGYESGLKFA